MSTAQPMPTPVKYSPRSDHKFATFLYSLATKMANNQYFASSDPTAVELKATADKMSAANGAAKGGGPLATSARDKVRADAEKVVDRLVLFVGLNVRATTGDPATATDMILSTGLSVHRPNTYVKAQLTPKYGDSTGEVFLSARAAKGKAVYMFEYSLDGHTWTSVPQVMVSYVTITGLTAGQTYMFRFKVQTRKGVSEYSQIVTLLVH